MMRRAMRDPVRVERTDERRGVTGRRRRACPTSRCGLPRRSPSALLAERSSKVGLPVFTVRARSKAVRMWRGQAAYLRSGTRKTVSTYSAGSSSSARIAATSVAELGLVPVDLLRQVGDHRDLVVVEADGAGVLALGAAGGRGAVAVAERDGAVQPVGELSARPSRPPRPPPAAARARRRQRGDLADRHGAECPRAGDGCGAFTTRPPR